MRWRSPASSTNWIRRRGPCARAPTPIIARIVGRINQATEDIAALNREIQRAESLGRDTTALQDRRELLIDEVSAALPVKVTYTERRGVELYTEQGLLLVGSTARLLEFARTPVIGPRNDL